MEQDFNQPNSSPDLDALQWACEVLDLKAEKQAVKKNQTRRKATTSFFHSLKSNDFFASDNTLEAVEIIHGKPGGGVPAFVRWHEKNLFQQLDDTVEWFASQLGVQDHQQLVAALSNRLSSFDCETISENVRGYGKRIWAAARSVQSPMNESDLAVKRILQALFHISTIRPTKRRNVRSQWVGNLKDEFSEDRLAAARKTIRNYETPNEIFHRPFLSLLTSDEESVENFQIKPPVSSGTQALAYSRNFRSESPAQSQQESGNNWWLAIVVVASLVGLIIKVGGAVERSSNRSPRITLPAKMPAIRFDPKLAPDDPGSVETALKILKSLQGEDSDLPTMEEFKKIKKKAEAAQQRIEARKHAQAGSPKSDLFRPAETGQKVELQSRSDSLDKTFGQSVTKSSVPKSLSRSSPWEMLDEAKSRQMEWMRNPTENPLETIDKVLERHRKYEQFREAEREAFKETMRKQQETHKKIREDTMKRLEESRRRWERISPSRIAPSRDLRNPRQRLTPFGDY